MSQTPNNDQGSDSAQGRTVAKAAPLPLSRKILIGVNMAIAALILGKALLDPTVGHPQSVELPDTVELEQWDFESSDSLEPFTLATGESDHSQEGQRYAYTTADFSAAGHPLDLTLTIELRYMLDTSGFIERLLMGHSEFQSRLAAADPNADPITTDVRYQPGVGYSGRFQIEDQTVLSACINPRGESTFYIDQFLHNQSIYDHDPTRLLSILFGREAWSDQRCLWTHMTLEPSGTASLTPQEAEAKLDETWAEWYATWQPKFPRR